MVNRKLNTIDEIKDWFYFNKDLLIAISTALIFGFGYWILTKSNRQIDFKSYNNEVQLIHLNYEKSYSLPEIYSTKQKLDKIIFDLEYLHNNINFKSKAVVYWEYLTPKFEKIIEDKEFDKLIVKCKNNFPEEAMVFIKKE